MYFFTHSLRRVIPAVLLCCTVLSMPQSGLCEEDAPINIEADEMISQELKNKVIFIGNVDATQGKVTIRTDKMTVEYEEKDKKTGKKEAAQSQSKSSSVKKLICIGNVEVTQEDWLGTGERMDYFADERKVILSGDAKAFEGQNMVSGKSITYYLDEKRSIVEGGANVTEGVKNPGRVKAVIQQ